jgi:hypothetical protein
MGFITPQLLAVLTRMYVIFSAWMICSPRKSPVLRRGEGCTMAHEKEIEEPRLFLVANDPWKGTNSKAFSMVVGEILVELTGEDLPVGYSGWPDPVSTPGLRVTKYYGTILTKDENYAFVIINMKDLIEISWEQASSLAFHKFQKKIYGKE